MDRHSHALVCAALLIALQLVAAPVSRAETYHVAMGGDDGDAGSEAAPWATLQHAADTVAPGDVVIVEPGEYAGMHLTTSGTAGERIVFSGMAGAHVNSDNPTTPDGINLEGASFVTVEGFEVTDTSRAGIRAVLCESVIIRNNRADQNFRWGILTGFCDDLLIENNECSRSEDEHGIYVSNSGDRPVVRGNRLWGNNANGLHMNGDLSAGGDGVISEALVENNVIWDNGTGGGSGINGDGVQDSVIQNNVLYAAHASGISLYRIDGGESSTGNLIINNTVIVADDGRWALNIQDASTDNRVINNILLNDHSFRGAIDISSDSLSGFVSDYNVVIGRFTTDGASTVMDLSEWQAAGYGASSIEAAAAELFADVAGDDYHLVADSPAEDVGTATDAPMTDFEGQPRPLGDGIDIGADEHCPDPCTTPPSDGGMPDAGGTPDAGTPDATTPDGGGGDASASDSGGGVDAGMGGDDGGCGCRTVGRGAGGALPAWVAVLLLAARRRRRGRR
jgi:parallel beta-helix repeat protein